LKIKAGAANYFGAGYSAVLYHLLRFRIVAGARLFESTFGMSYETALWAGAAATIIYTFVGGFLAVAGPIPCRPA
jgi:Na+/proline symporter